MVVCIWVLAIVPKLFSLPQVGEPLTILLFLLPYLFACIFYVYDAIWIYDESWSHLCWYSFSRLSSCYLSRVSLGRRRLFLRFGKWWVICFLLLRVSKGFIRINTAGASLHEVAHEYRVLWIQAGVYFILSCIIYRYQIIRSRKMIIKQYRYMKMRRMLRERE